MILIITHKEDYTVDFIVEKFNKLNIDYYRLNCEDIDDKGYVLKINKKVNYLINNSIDAIDSIWFRRTKPPKLIIEDNSKRLYLLNEYRALLLNLYCLLDDKVWLSNPFSIYKAENKLHQLSVAKNIGFNIPETLVTSQHHILKEFIKKYNNNVIIKPLSTGRVIGQDSFKNIFCNKLDINHIEQLNKYSVSPAIYQPYIEKEYELRITVVSDKVFCAKVDSQLDNNTKIDWRRGKNKFTEYSLPRVIENKCIEIVKKINLAFGAIDIIKAKSGEYVFLEINPNGQWAWIEIETGMPISDEIIKYLGVHNV